MGPPGSTLGPSGAHFGNSPPLWDPILAYFCALGPTFGPSGAHAGPWWPLGVNFGRFGDVLGAILEALLVSFLAHFSDTVSEGLLARIWHHFRTVSGPIRT